MANGKQLMKFCKNIGIWLTSMLVKQLLLNVSCFYRSDLHKIGETHDGTATMDWMARAWERGTNASAATTVWNYLGNKYKRSTD